MVFIFIFVPTPKDPSGIKGRENLFENLYSVFLYPFIISFMVSLIYLIGFMVNLLIRSLGYFTYI
jgi:hypothetical protein